MAFKKLVEEAQSSRSDYDKLERYYESDERLDALGVTLPEDVRVLEMISEMPKLAVDVLVEVLNVEGFTLENDDDGILDTLRRWWQANNLDTEIHLAFTEALVQGTAYLLVGYGTDDIPRITVHDSKHVAIRRDLFGDVAEAVIVYGDEDERFASHYYSGLRSDYREESSDWEPVGGPQETGVAGVPVVPMVNRARLKDLKNGRSEMKDVLTLADAESRSLTNLQVAQEILALPQRYLFADGQKDFKDQNGAAITKFKAYMSALWTGPADAKAGQFPGADLSQIINVIKLYSQKMSAKTGIPPSMLGISTDNPASAEAMRAAKERLITKGELKQRLFGDPIEEAMRLALEMYGELPEDGAITLETDWRDVATPSKSAKAANILQGHSQGVITGHTAREHLELTPEQRAYEDAAEDTASALARSVGLGASPARKTSEGVAE